MDKRNFSLKIADWYEQNRRNLPWRTTQDPYRVWLSEIILQQTRVIQGLPYYLKFVEKFSNVFALASASEQEVLRLWQGLGYYTRARNLHKCAKMVVDTYGGKFPDRYELLLTLPGIGQYTAAAIASFSFQERVAVVDGNVSRVLARVYGIDHEINSPHGKKIFWQLANELIQPVPPDVHNQAMMEFGALWCTPKTPKCENCIFAKSCFAALNNLQNKLPVKAKAKAARKRYFYYFVIRSGKSLMMKKRSGKDIWAGLYDFYLVEKKRAVKPDTLISDDVFLRQFGLMPSSVSPIYKHVLTHQTIYARFITVENKSIVAASQRDIYGLYSLKKIDGLPKPVLISRFLSDYQF